MVLEGITKKLIMGFLGVILFTTLAVAMVPTVILSVINLSQITDLPLANFYASNGLVLIILSIVIFLGVLALLFGMISKKGR